MFVVVVVFLLLLLLFSLRGKCLSIYNNRLAGLVVKAGAKDPGFESRLRLDFSRSSHTSDLNTPVAFLPGAWHYRVSAGTGRPGVSIL